MNKYVRVIDVQGRAVHRSDCDHLNPVQHHQVPGVADRPAVLRRPQQQRE